MNETRIIIDTGPNPLSNRAQGIAALVLVTRREFGFHRLAIALLQKRSVCCDACQRPSA